MSPHIYDERGRRISTPSKGERREKAILDEAERLLGEVGLEAMTVESIAAAAGITRGALYFYFRSKNDVLAALVQRTVAELGGAILETQASSSMTVAEAIRRAIENTAKMWHTHGSVMRAAIDLSECASRLARPKLALRA